MAPLCYAAKFYPSLTLVCARVGEANKGKEGILSCHLATLAEIALYTTYLLPLFALSTAHGSEGGRKGVLWKVPNVGVVDHRPEGRTSSVDNVIGSPLPLSLFGSHSPELTLGFNTV